ncbi:MAG: 23S rRNA (adenine(2503)-C(2))-methyltransferase RlmN, partial [Clostridia bacterium]|nr:23S rRNA (adenine(2503)-C(2))-methyltransferase RlmN [Clostridia bacterium]
KHLICHINVIRLNSVKENNLESVTKGEAYKFVKGLIKLGVSVTLRRTMGADIEGACGQLRKRVISDNL